MEEGDDRALSEAMRQRHPNAWAVAYDRLAPDMLMFLLHLLRGNRRAAEDLHQEVWLAALAGIERFDVGQGELRGWLFGIARRKVAGHLRQCARRETRDDGVAGETLVEDHGLLPPDVILAVERVSAVRAALAELGPVARQVLTGKYVDGRSVNELAANMQRSPKAVESLLSRSRARLRALLHWYFDNEQAIQDSQ